VTPRKTTYLRRNWLTTLALLVPAVRLLGVLRPVRGLAVLRGVRLVRVVGGASRSMRALGGTMRRRGFGYATALSVDVALAGAAGMYAFEVRVPGGGINDFSSALWWTAMILTTMGSDYFPKTAEGACCACCWRSTASPCYAGGGKGEVAGAGQVARLERDIAALPQRLEDVASTLAARNQGSGPA